MPDNTPKLDGDALVNDIVDNPTKYGFAWFVDSVEKSGMKLAGVPLVKHENVDLIRETFGDASCLASMDGTSRHVKNQAIVREARYADHHISYRALQILIVRNWLGQTTRRQTVVIENHYIALDGKSYKTEVEALAASKAWTIDQQQNQTQA